ncbi:hypothetical protein Tco_0899354 [Tanacetum coccineum]
MSVLLSVFQSQVQQSVAATSNDPNYGHIDIDEKQKREIRNTCRYETRDHFGVYSGNLTEAVDEVPILAGLSADIYFSVHADKLEVNKRVVTHCSKARGSWFISNMEYLPDQVKEEIQQAL